MELVPAILLHLSLRQTCWGPAPTVCHRKVSALEGDEVNFWSMGPTPCVHFRKVSTLTRWLFKRGWLYPDGNFPSYPDIDSCFFCQVKIRVSGAFNSTLSFPITIGSVPYRPPPPQYQQEYHPQPSAFPSAPPLGGNYGSFSQPPSAPPLYADSQQSYPNAGELTMSITL